MLLELSKINEYEPYLKVSIKRHDAKLLPAPRALDAGSRLPRGAPVVVRDLHVSHEVGHARGLVVTDRATERIFAEVVGLAHVIQ